MLLNGTVFTDITVNSERKGLGKVRYREFYIVMENRI